MSPEALRLDPNWSALDHELLWHPYAATSEKTPAAVTHARGCEIFLSNGQSLIDGMSSWWCAIHGYNHPDLNAAIQDQLGQMAHVMFGGLTHAPAIELGRRLVQMTPQGLDRVFLADSGSVAVEVAIKMALQYQLASGQTQRKKLLTVRGGYYGDTTGAMSICDPEGGMHAHFDGAILQQIFAPAPAMLGQEREDGSDLAALASILQQHGAQAAALIIEPLVQGAGGMRIYRADYLNQATRMARDYGLLVIFDEIATGFGRTGSMFALQQTEVVPDILCLGKALTGGYMTLSAVLAGKSIPATIEAGAPGLFMHGPTFMANPLACSVACASIDLLLNSPWQQRVSDIEDRLKRHLLPLRDRPGVNDVRVKGAIGIVETSRPLQVSKLCQHFIRRGVWIRPFRNLLYLMPPFIISPEQLQVLTKAIEEVVNQGLE